MFKIAHQLLD